MPFDSRFAAFKLMQEKNKGGGYDRTTRGFLHFAVSAPIKSLHLHIAHFTVVIDGIGSLEAGLVTIHINVIFL